jgi:hypothetical protein
MEIQIVNGAMAIAPYGVSCEYEIKRKNIDIEMILLVPIAPAWGCIRVVGVNKSLFVIVR